MCFENRQKNSRCSKFYGSNIIDRLEQKFKKFCSDLILIGGDFNSKTGTKPDYTTQDTWESSVPPGDYERDTVAVSITSEIVSINYFGQQLLKLCAEYP